MSQGNQEGQFTVRTLIQAAITADSELDVDVFAVSNKAVKSEYLDADDEPSTVYDPESWTPVRAVYVDTEGVPALLIVYEGNEAETEGDD